MRYIVEVARAEAITIAAETLGLTQPAVTRSIAEVEDELGVLLFHRVPRGMRLTEAGQRFIQHAKRILGDVDDLVTEMREGVEAVTGRLRIGSAPGTDIQNAMRSFKTLARTHPAIRAEIVTGSAETLCPRLVAGEINAIVGASSYLERWRELEVTRLCRYYAGCMVRKGHPLTRMERPAERDVFDYPLLLPESVDAHHSQLAQRYAAHGLVMQPHYVTDNPFLIRTLINHSDAFHLHHNPDPDFTVIRKDFDVITGLVDLPVRYFCVASSPSHPKTAAFRLFEGILMDDFLGPNAKYPWSPEDVPAQTS
jgi:DNA-binding transcriptional LysR family regulator